MRVSGGKLIGEVFLVRTSDFSVESISDSWGATYTAKQGQPASRASGGALGRTF